MKKTFIKSKLEQLGFKPNQVMRIISACEVTSSEEPPFIPGKGYEGEILGYDPAGVAKLIQWNGKYFGYLNNELNETFNDYDLAREWASKYGVKLGENINSNFKQDLAYVQANLDWDHYKSFEGDKIHQSDLVRELMEQKYGEDYADDETVAKLVDEINQGSIDSACDDSKKKINSDADESAVTAEVAWDEMVFRWVDGEDCPPLEWFVGKVNHLDYDECLKYSPEKHQEVLDWWEKVSGKKVGA